MDILKPYMTEWELWHFTMTLKFDLLQLRSVQVLYDEIVSKIDSTGQYQYIGNKEKCRYCGCYNKNIQSIKDKVALGEITNSSLSSFKKIAHSLPALIGNSRIISKDECDSCNEKFNDLENNLDEFLGVSRTTSKIKGRKKYLKLELTIMSLLIFVRMI